MAVFAYTILYVQNVAQSIDFYEKSFDLTRKLVAPDGSYGELSTGSTTLSFASVTLAASNLRDGFEPSSPSAKPFGIEIGFSTHDVQATLERAVAAGGTLVESPKAKPWGQVVAYVRDPDGFLVEICTPMD
jgi:lactoylglutathione lyase